MILLLLAHNRLDAARHAPGPDFVLLKTADDLKGYNSVNARLLVTDHAYLHPRFTEILQAARRRNLQPNAPYPDKDLRQDTRGPKRGRRWDD